MKHLFTRITSLILVLAMSLSLLCGNAWAAEVESVEIPVETTAITTMEATSGKCGKNVNWDYNAETKVLTISGKGAMYDYDFPMSDNHAPWIRRIQYETEYGESGETSECYDISKIVVKKGVTAIGMSAFDSCKTVKSVVIEDGVTTIGEDAFLWCESLTSVSLPDSVTAIEDRAFSSCTSLTSIKLPKQLEKIGLGAFSSCALKKVEFPSKVTIIGAQAFSRNAITELVIPDNVKTIDRSAFSDCNQLKKVTFGKNVSTIEAYAFLDCPNLKEVTIPKNVKKIGSYAFGYVEPVDMKYEKVSGFKISGYAGSTAESYAKKEGITFKKLQGTTVSKTSLSKVSNETGKKLKVQWKKNNNATGYEIQYSTDKNFKESVTKKTVTKKTTTSATYTNLTKGKTYYVRIRTYKTVSGKKNYSDWSTAKSVKISK